MTSTRPAFRKAYAYSARAAESARVLDRYADRVPVIVERGNDATVPPIDKMKYLVPTDLTWGQLQYVGTQLPAPSSSWWGRSSCPRRRWSPTASLTSRSTRTPTASCFSGENTFGE